VQLGAVNGYRNTNCPAKYPYYAANTLNKQIAIAVLDKPLTLVEN